MSYKRPSLFENKIPVFLFANEILYLKDMVKHESKEDRLDEDARRARVGARVALNKATDWIFDKHADEELLEGYKPITCKELQNRMLGKPEAPITRLEYVRRVIIARLYKLIALRSRHGYSNVNVLDAVQPVVTDYYDECFENLGKTDGVNTYGDIIELLDLKSEFVSNGYDWIKTNEHTKISWAPKETTPCT